VLLTESPRVNDARSPAISALRCPMAGPKKEKTPYVLGMRVSFLKSTLFPTPQKRSCGTFLCRKSKRQACLTIKLYIFLFQDATGCVFSFLKMSRRAKRVTFSRRAKRVRRIYRNNSENISAQTNARSTKPCVSGKTFFTRDFWKTAET